MNYDLQVEIKKKYGKQYRFAQAMGKGDSHVSLVIRGRRNLSPEDKKKWAEALDKTVSELFPEN